MVWVALGHRPHGRSLNLREVSMRYPLGFSMALLLIPILGIASLESPEALAKLEGLVGGTGLICTMSGGIVMLYLGITRTTPDTSDHLRYASGLLRYRHRTFYSGAVLLVLWFVMTHAERFAH